MQCWYSLHTNHWLLCSIITARLKYTFFIEVRILEHHEIFIRICWKYQIRLCKFQGISSLKFLIDSQVAFLGVELKLIGRGRAIIVLNFLILKLGAGAPTGCCGDQPYNFGIDLNYHIKVVIVLNIHLALACTKYKFTRTSLKLAW